MLNLQVPIWCVGRVNWCVRDIQGSDTSSLSLVPAQHGAAAVPLFSTAESVNRFIEEEAGRTKLVSCSLENVEALRQFLEYLRRAGETEVIVDPSGDGPCLQFTVAQLIAELPSEERQLQSSVYRSDYFREWYKRNGG